jgi:hypothetical protein
MTETTPSQRAPKALRRRRRAGSLLAGALLVASASLTSAGAASAATTAPYSDSSSVGSLGLCDQAGHQITGGQLSATPLAWRYVSSVAAQAPYDGATRTAVAMAYQPRQGLLPQEWSGEQLTASSRYSNPSAPMAAATNADPSLADFLSDFPANWDGFVQLRLYLGAEGEPQYSVHYPSLDLQVTGTSWHVVGGGTVNCQAGTAESLETIVLPSTTTTTIASTTTAKSHGSTTTTTVKHGTSSTGSGAANSSKGGSTSSIWWWLLPVLVVILLAALGTLLWLRQKRARAPGSPKDASPNP